MTPIVERNLPPGRASRRLHPLPLRVMHWSNAVAMIIMIVSGWHIYEDEPIFGFVRLPKLAADPEGALLWHFAAMWLLVINGLCYLTYGLATGRFRRMLLPIRPREVAAAVKDALRFRLEHGDVTVYNAVQRLLYVGVILVAVVQIVSGLAIWKPVQFQELMILFGDFQGARLAHFLGMSAIVLFLAIHILLAVLVPRTLVAMITGGPRIDQAPTPHVPQPAE